MPAGKAMALAAMPTAVFVGMGLAPKLALADDKDIPFAPGPCVTRSDEPAESESPSPSESAKPSDEASDKSSDKKTDEPSSESSGGESDSDDDSGKTRDEPKPAESPSASAPADEADKPTEEESDAEDSDSDSDKSKSLLDPLGIGDKIKDLFDGSDDSESEAEPAASETSEPADEPSEEPADDQPEPGSASEDKAPTRDEPETADEAEKVTDETDEVTDKTAEAIKEAAAKAGAEVEELDDKVKGTDPVKDEDIPEGAKPRFPCPTADPEALAAAEVEQGIPSLPDDPWVLESSKLTLSGLDYKGIVEVRTASGKIKKALKFTASKVKIKDLHQMAVGPNGTTMHVEAEKGTHRDSEIRNGTVTMYTEELKGKLFGIIPVTFSPKSPPPLNVPLAIFTDVRVVQAAQFGGTLTVPGLHNYFTGGNAG
ncbi:hypothetical protein V1460_08210 [Streptomyces sp. SCSIO 30461]